MDTINVRHFKNKTVFTLTNSQGVLVRKVELIPGNEYVLNPINNRYDMNRGRKVMFESIEHTKHGSIALVKYLDSLRPGKVQVDDLDNIDMNIEINAAPVAIKEEPVIFKEFGPAFQLYLDILNVIDNKKNASYIAFVNQQQIAEAVSTSTTNVSKRLKQLIRYGAIEKVSPGAYKLLSNSIWRTPYRIVHEVISLIQERPELLQSYKQQALLLDVPLEDISQAWSFINLTLRHG